MELCCVFSSDNEIEISQVKDILENNGIPTLIKNLHTQNLFGGVKPFSGHDPIAGTIEIHISTSDVEKAMDLLGVEQNDKDNEKTDILTTSDDKDELPAEYYERRRIFFAFILSACSFLFIPIAINIPNMIYFYKHNKKMFYMLLLISVLMGGSSLFFLIS